MQVNGPNQVHGPQALAGPHFRKAPGADAAKPSPTADRVEFSAEAQEASRVAEALETRAAEGVAGPDGVRTGLVNRLRGEIANGTYDSADKLDVALDRLLDEIG